MESFDPVFSICFSIKEICCRNTVSNSVYNLVCTPEISPAVLLSFLFSFFAGYGNNPYEVQPAGLTPEAESAGQYSNIFKLFV